MKQLIARVSTARDSVLGYIDAGNGVSCYVNSINNIAIPDLIEPPPGYGDYAASFGTVRLHVMAWMDEVIPSFGLIPDAFLNFGQTIQDQLQAIASDLEDFSSKSDTGAVRQTIEKAVAILQTELGRCGAAVNDLDKSIVAYQNSLKPDSDRLESLSKEMLTAAGADQDAIDKQNAVLANFDAMIQARNEIATLEKVGNWDLNIFTAVAGVAIGLPFSPAAGFFVGLVFGVGTASFTSYDEISPDPDYEQSVAQIQETMSDVNKEIGWLNTAIGLAQAVNSQLTSLIGQCDRVRGQVATVLEFWKRQSEDLTAMLDALGDLLKQLADPHGLALAKADVARAQDSWRDLASFMQDMAGIQYTTVLIPPPVSDSQP